MIAPIETMSPQNLALVDPAQHQPQHRRDQAGRQQRAQPGPLRQQRRGQRTDPAHRQQHPAHRCEQQALELAPRPGPQRREPHRAQQAYQHQQEATANQPRPAPPRHQPLGQEVPLLAGDAPHPGQAQPFAPQLERPLPLVAGLGGSAGPVLDLDHRGELTAAPCRFPEILGSSHRGPPPPDRGPRARTSPMDATIQVPPPQNEPVLAYRPQSPERARLEAELARQVQAEVEIPCVIGGQRVTTGRLEPVVMPHDHAHVLARYHAAGPAEMARAIDATRAARAAWQAMRFEARAAIFLRAAELLAGPARMTINAATMLGQSKTCHQAEIDSACEFIDFLRFNVAFAEQLRAEQPRSMDGAWNALDLRPLDGFVLAITPFNFTAIAGNLPTAPALMGNTVVWKPSESQTLAAWHTLQILEQAGLPPGVINFVPGAGPELVPPALEHPDFAGLHFTGSTAVFRDIWRQVGQNMERYRNYPRLVGETGGKDFIIAHPSADPDALVTAIVRGGYEFQGQKCSAASRIYVPETLWRGIADRLCETIASLPMGDVRDFKNFLSAVIKKSAFDKHAAAIAEARASSSKAKVLVGGETDDSKGLLRAPHPDPGPGARLPHPARGAVRPHRHRLRLSRPRLQRHPDPGGPDLALCLDRSGVRPRPGRGRGGAHHPAPRRRQLLHQRQADRCGGQPAAVRRRPGVGHQRQGRFASQPHALGLAAHGQGNSQSADRPPLPVHGLTERARLARWCSPDRTGQHRPAHPHAGSHALRPPARDGR